MPYQTKTPPTKITLTKEKFNQMLNYINSDAISDNERSKVSNLTNKMLKYGLPYKNEGNEEMISIHFYTSELSDFIYIFLNNCIRSQVIEVDYYTEVIKQKEDYKMRKQEEK